MRHLEHLIKLVREEIQAEGPDGGGYSDVFIQSSINEAIIDLSEVYTIRDRETVYTKAGVEEFKMEEIFPDTPIENIIRITYDGKNITGVDLDKYLDTTVPQEGPVREWTLWGSILILIGEVEDDKELELWVTRAPKRLVNKDDEPETPFHADRAILQYAVQSCYRESNDYERAGYHMQMYQIFKDSVQSRGVPQGQRSYTTQVNSVYSGPVRLRGRIHSRTDKNPGGY